MGGISVLKPDNMWKEIDNRNDNSYDDSIVVYELSRNSETPEQEIKRVLTFFPETNKYQDHILKITDAVIGTLSPDPKMALQMREEIKPITERLLETRQLNETYMGHMTPQPIIPAIWGNMISAYINANTCAREASQAETKMEPEAIGYLMEMVGYKYGEASGVFTTGGTEANHTALTLARLLVEKEAHEKNNRVDKTTILASPYAHYSLGKSVRQLGGLNQDIKVQVIQPEDYRMSVNDLEKKLKEMRHKGKSIMAVWAIAGETETGKVDDLQAISKLTEKYEVPLIVDGAYGAPYRISKVGEKFSGMERAFAVTLDPQKTFYEPYPAGALLFSKVEDHALIGDIQKASYAGFSEGYQNNLEAFMNNDGNLGQKRLSGSMGAQAITATIASMRTLGMEGYRTIFNLTLDRIGHLHERLLKSDILYPLHEPDLNLLCFGLNEKVQKGLGIEDNDTLGRYVNTTRERLDKGITGQGGYHFSTTNLPGDNGSEKWVFRACLMNPRTTNRTIDDAIGQLEDDIKGDLKKVYRPGIS